MILTCPSCRTRYQADSAHFVTPGRNVRCAKCGHVWFQAAPTPDGELEPEPVMTPAVPARGPSVAPVAQAAASEGSSAQLGAGPAAEDSISAPAETRGYAGGARFAQSAGWAALVVLIAAIGWASIPMFDPQSDRPSLMLPGDRVKFTIDRIEL